MSRFSFLRIDSDSDSSAASRDGSVHCAATPVKPCPSPTSQKTVHTAATATEAAAEAAVAKTAVSGEAHVSPLTSLVTTTTTTAPISSRYYLALPALSADVPPPSRPYLPNPSRSSSRRPHSEERVDVSPVVAEQKATTPRYPSESGTHVTQGEAALLPPQDSPSRSSDATPKPMSPTRDSAAQGSALPATNMPMMHTSVLDSHVPPPRPAEPDSVAATCADEENVSRTTPALAPSHTADMAFLHHRLLREKGELCSVDMQTTAVATKSNFPASTKAMDVNHPHVSMSPVPSTLEQNVPGARSRWGDYAATRGRSGSGSPTPAPRSSRVLQPQHRKPFRSSSSPSPVREASRTPAPETDDTQRHAMDESAAAAAAFAAVAARKTKVGCGCFGNSGKRRGADVADLNRDDVTRRMRRLRRVDPMTAIPPPGPTFLLNESDAINRPPASNRPSTSLLIHDSRVETNTIVPNRTPNIINNNNNNNYDNKKDDNNSSDNSSCVHASHNAQEENHETNRADSTIQFHSTAVTHCSATRTMTSMIQDTLSTSAPDASHALTFVTDDAAASHIAQHTREVTENTDEPRATTSPKIISVASASGERSGAHADAAVSFSTLPAPPSASQGSASPVPLTQVSGAPAQILFPVCMAEPAPCATDSTRVDATHFGAAAVQCTAPSVAGKTAVEEARASALPSASHGPEELQGPYNSVQQQEQQKEEEEEKCETRREPDSLHGRGARESNHRTHRRLSHSHHRHLHSRQHPHDTDRRGPSHRTHERHPSRHRRRDCSNATSRSRAGAHGNAETNNRLPHHSRPASPPHEDNHPSASTGANGDKPSEEFHHRGKVSCAATDDMSFHSPAPHESSLLLPKRLPMRSQRGSITTTAAAVSSLDSPCARWLPLRRASGERSRGWGVCVAGMTEWPRAALSTAKEESEPVCPAISSSSSSSSSSGSSSTSMHGQEKNSHDTCRNISSNSNGVHGSNTTTNDHDENSRNAVHTSPTIQVTHARDAKAKWRMHAVAEEDQCSTPRPTAPGGQKEVAAAAAAAHSASLRGANTRADDVHLPAYQRRIWRDMCERQQRELSVLERQWRDLTFQPNVSRRRQRRWQRRLQETGHEGVAELSLLHTRADSEVNGRTHETHVRPNERDAMRNGETSLQLYYAELGSHDGGASVGRVPPHPRGDVQTTTRTRAAAGTSPSSSVSTSQDRQQAIRATFERLACARRDYAQEAQKERGGNDGGGGYSFRPRITARARRLPPRGLSSRVDKVATKRGDVAVAMRSDV